MISRCPPANHPGGHAIRHCIVRYISHDHSARPDQTISPNLDTVDNSGADPYKANLAHFDFSPNSHSGRELCSIPDEAIVIDRDAGINNHVVTNGDAGLHDGAREHDRSFTNPRVIADDRRWMQNGAERQARIDGDRSELPPRSIISHGDHHALYTIRA
jgi:hypothetical protein